MTQMDPNELPDSVAITQLQHAWGLYRDTARWDELSALYAPDARMKTTWFDGLASDFVAASQRMATKAQVLVLHFIGPTTVQVNAHRAVAETRVMLLLRDRVGGQEVDVTCYGRFVDRLVKQGGRWLIQQRDPIYEKDMLSTVKPGDALPLDDDELRRFPAGYRHLAYLQSQGGAQIVFSIPAHNSPEQRSLYAGAQAWLDHKPQ